MVAQDDLDKNQLIEQLHKQQYDLKESLKYASYIQRALFPGKSVINRHFPENFILFKPKDIVSGDFYWIYQFGSKVFIAVGDCTGHGVPGAFMSILGISFLNQIMAKSPVTNSATLLNLLREYVMSALNQTGENSEQKDGIDMSLCLFDKETNQLNFAGAFNPAYIIRKGELIQLNADKMPIGIAADDERSFTNTSFYLENGDMIYLFSDGFVDQFGGLKDKKYKFRPFREFLTKISPRKVEDQKQDLIDEFERWKGDGSQLDDIIILGIRYSQ